MIRINLPEATTEATPAGKRRIVRTVWGNTNGYVSGRFWKTFGPTYAVGVEAEAQAWLDEVAQPKTKES